LKPPPECSISWDQAAAFRLRRQRLAGTEKATLPALVRALNGVQAQVMSAAELALRVRTAGITSQDIHTALWQRRSLVRTSAMRQTLHLLPSSDLSLYIAALRPSRMGALMRGIEKFGVTEREVESFNQTVVAALKSGPRTQRDLTTELRKNAGKKLRAWMDEFWSPVRPAMVAGLICYGQEQGREATLLRVDQWLPGQKAVAEEHAKQTLLERYLKAYGPATLKDFAYWSGMPVKEASAVWTSLLDHMTEVSLEGQKAFILSQDLKMLGEAEFEEPVVRLLPYFDMYLLAHAAKDHLIEPQFYKRVFRSQWWISQVVLLNGRIIGTWSRAKLKTDVMVKTEIFRKLARAERLLLDEEVERVGRLLST
jgi:hypothetical protein